MSERPIVIPVSGTITRAADTLAFYQGDAGNAAPDASQTTIKADSTLYSADKA